MAQTSAGKMVITHVIDDTAMLKKQIETRDAVQSLRKQGKSYKAIAEELKLTVYEVRKQLK
jgi:DNA invertase Pin-like site-specific DNA recombinase